MSHRTQYPSPGGNSRREYDSYKGRRDFRRDRDRDGRGGRDLHHDHDFSRRPSPPRGSGGDSYRPPSYSHRDNLYDSQGGAQRHNYSDYDSRAAGPSSYHPPPPSYSQPPPPPPGDGMRPPQGDFSFRVEKPPGVQEPYDSYRPDAGRGQQYRPNGTSYAPGRPQSGPNQPSYRSLQNPRRGRGRDARGGRRGGYGSFKASDRELLNPAQTTGPEQTFYDVEAGATYRPMSELSDSDEAEMDISDNDGDAASTGEPSNKRARLSVQQSATDHTVPKWSNPDPYTALPPPDAASRQRKDVVQLIRKARVETKEAKRSVPAQAEEFISCVFDDSDVESEVEVVEVMDPPSKDTARVPGAATRSANNPKQNSAPIQANNREDASKLVAANNMSLPLQPPQQKPDSKHSAPKRQATLDGILGSRKRTVDDEIKLPAHAKLKKPARMPVAGVLVWDWKLKDGENPCPWLVADHSESNHVGDWLRKEVRDFYDHVKPRDFEQGIRQQLVDEFQALCRKAYGDVQVHTFGSFPSGLYLPTGDMDLVFCSDAMMSGGMAKYNSKKTLFKLQGLLISSGFSLPNDIECITKARVPLVKFIDSRTGLKVDVSFENLTGVRAVDTFLQWKRAYPVMPILVTVIKHFLAMRGLNEPVNGGIGGFSVICLVVSMLQHSPQVQSRNENPEHHLGDLLMEFFDLYGNRFNYKTTAIRLNPPGYVNKNRVAGFTYKNMDRLSIIDPNDPSNDISGGSSNIATITTLFSDAYRDLRNRMAYLAQAEPAERRGASILEVILAGDYSTFRLQRAHLAKLAETGLGPLPKPPNPVKRSPW